MLSPAYVGRRLAALVVVAVGVTIVVFFLIHLVPGDPARTLLGNRATDKAVATIHHEYGLDRPLSSQYWLFIDRLAHGNLGDSLFYRVPTTQLISERFGATLWLILYGTVFAVVLSVPLALIAASRRGGLRDQIVRVVPLVGLGMPSFWVGIILVLLLAVKARLFPVGGYGSGVGGHLSAMFLPALTVAVAMTPILVRSLRASLLDVLEADYITTARSKGLSEWRVVSAHALRNAAVSTVTVLGVNVAFLIGNTIVIEKVFALPGLGSLMIEAIFNRDFAVVQGLALVFAALVVLANLLTDLTYAALDPRVRLG